MNTINQTTRLALLLASAVTIAGCGNEQKTTYPERGAEVFYSYPNSDQTNVSTKAPIVLRLSSAVSDPSSLDSSMVSLVRAADDSVVDVSISMAEGSDDRSIILHPDSALISGETYRVEIGNILTEKGPLQFSDGHFSFTTALASEGPRSTKISSEEFVMVSMFPDNDELPILDFSALRFRFTQPIDSATVQYGTSIRLTDSDDQLVEANVLAKEHFLTISPVDKLTAGKNYTVVLSDQLSSHYGAPLVAPFTGTDSFSFVPKASGPTETMALIAPASGERSVLTGDIVNLVPVVSILLGDDTKSQQSGDVFAELAFVPNFPDATPLRIPRGSILTGDALEILISGVIPVSFDSGDVTIQFISDATGYLLPNPYTDAPSAPRQLRMMMDIAISTGGTVANAGFSQDLLHLELIGQAIVENGVLTTDAITVVEADVLGLETGYGVLNFRMQAYDDQLAAPSAPIDSAAPTIKSWMPGDDNALKQRKGEPVLIFFDELIDPKSLTDRVQLWQDGNQVSAADVSIKLDGAALIINSSFDYNKSYEIQLLDGITDLSGNTLAATTLSFETAKFVNGSLASPFIMTSYPGTPCALVNGSRNLPAGIAGRCDGGQDQDDYLPLAAMPADRDIRVRFSQNMDISSFVLGQSFRVEQLNANGMVIETVPGELRVFDREVRFMPDEPWQEDNYYQYVLVSNGNSRSSNCTPGSMICAVNGLPLKTRLLAKQASQAPTLNGGGPNFVMPFRGAAALDTIYTQLSNLPVADVNANTLRDAGEDNPIDNVEMLKNSTLLEIAETGGTVAKANVGCKVGQSCPKDTYAYILGALDADVQGYISAADIPNIAKSTVPQAVMDAGGGILVYLYPNVMMASETTVYAETTLGPLATTDPAPTGPLIMRMRHQCDARDTVPNNQPNASSLPPCNGHHGLVEGWIIAGTNDQGEPQPEFLAILNLYLDTPALNLVIKVLGLLPTSADHNMNSNGLANVSVRGPVAFIEDGRIEIGQISQEDVIANIEISAVAGLAGGNVKLRIPAGGVNLNYISSPVKR